MTLCALVYILLQGLGEESRRPDAQQNLGNDGVLSVKTEFVDAMLEALHTIPPPKPVLQEVEL
jgi:hypothetical protein